MELQILSVRVSSLARVSTVGEVLVLLRGWGIVWKQVLRCPRWEVGFGLGKSELDKPSLVHSQFSDPTTKHDSSTVWFGLFILGQIPKHDPGALLLGPRD